MLAIKPITEEFVERSIIKYLSKMNGGQICSLAD